MRHRLQPDRGNSEIAFYGYPNRRARREAERQPSLLKIVLLALPVGIGLWLLIIWLLWFVVNRI